MTREETAQILAGVRLLWPHSNLGGSPNEIIVTWHDLLSDFPVDQVEAAVRELAAAGREFAPPPGVVVAACADRVTDIPDWDEAWTEVTRLLRRVGRYGGEGGQLGAPPERAFSHPVIAAFAIPAWRELCDGPAPGTSAYGTHHAQQRNAYQAMRARATRDTSLVAIGAPRSRSLPRPMAAALEAPGGQPQ